MVDDGSRYFLCAAPMVTLSVAGGGCWRPEDGWPWLRIRGQHEGETSKGRVVLDRCLRSEGGWEKEIDVELQGQKDGVISLELWVGASRFTDFLQFARGWSVDLQQWVKSGAAKRWYEVKTVRAREQRIPSVANELEYFESELELQSSAACVYVGIVAIEEDAAVESLELPQPDSTMRKGETAKTNKSTFRFVLPYRWLARSGKLRAVRVGQIVHELRIDVLHDLLPLTLYGRSNPRHRQRSSSNRPKELGDGLTKALVLLQLSTQYANYCVDELDRYSSKLEIRRTMLKGKLNRMKQRQTLLKEQTTSLHREAEVLGCSLDGMQSLLQELDPEALARLQGEGSPRLQKTTS